MTPSTNPSSSESSSESSFVADAPSPLPDDLCRALDELARTPVLLVATDYDGTLAPIVDNPEDARADREAMVAVEAIADLPQTFAAVISGRSKEACEEAAGATRIKRLRDTLGNQMISELLVKNIARRGYMLAIDKDVIRVV